LLLRAILVIKYVKSGILRTGAEPGFEYRGAIDKTNWTTDKEK
jgi:hypothetical protein